MPKRRGTMIGGMRADSGGGRLLRGKRKKIGCFWAKKHVIFAILRNRVSAVHLPGAQHFLS